MSSSKALPFGNVFINSSPGHVLICPNVFLLAEECHTLDSPILLAFLDLDEEGEFIMRYLQDVFETQRGLFSQCAVTRMYPAVTLVLL